ncbi:hypothetical protein ACHAQA_008453 [Verticillium albo-atrum]
MHLHLCTINVIVIANTTSTSSLDVANNTRTPSMERTPPAVELQSQCSTVANRSARVSMGLEKLAAQSSPTSDVGDELRELAGVVSALSQSAEELGQNLTNSSSLTADARRQLSSSLSACELLLGGVASDLEEALSTSSRDPSELQGFVDAAELWRLQIELVFAFQDLTQMSDSDEQQATLLANETKFEDLERLMAEFQLSHPAPAPAEPEPAIPPEKGGVLPDYDTAVAGSSTHLSMASNDDLHEQYQHEQPEMPLDQHLTKQKGKSKSKSSKGVFGGFGNIFKTISSKINPVEPLVTPLCHAASIGNIPQIKGLLTEGANINGHNEKGHTPLIAAILANRLDAVSCLLDNNVKVTTKDSNRSMPPLFHAAEAGYIDIMTLLLKHGADAKATSTIGTPHFIETVEKAPLASVGLLLDHGADPNAVSAVGRHVLVAAVQRNDLPAVRLLLDHGAKISATNITGQPLLGLAVANKRLDMAKLLIDNGANVDARAGPNGCPLSVATNTRNIDLLRLLLAANANPNGKDVKGAPVLVNAVLKGSLEIVTMLLDAGADADARDITGRAALLVAVQQDKLAIARLLLQHGASASVSGHSGTHFLTLFAKQLAPDEDKPDFMRLLIKCGADPNRHSLPWGYLSNMPLGHCIKYDKVELVRVLMEGGADPHITVPGSPNSPRSPFEYALSHNKVDAMRIILTHHDRDKKEDKGKDPIQAGFSVAIETGKTEMVDLFLDQGLGSLDRAIFLAGTSGQRDLLVALEARQKIVQRLEWELESPRLEAGPVSSPIEASGGHDGEGPPAYAATGPAGLPGWKQ